MGDNDAQDHTDSAPAEDIAIFDEVRDYSPARAVRFD
jgi:hypothetical protein